MPWNVNLPTTEYYAADDPKLEEVVLECSRQPVVAIDTETTGLEIWKRVPLFFSLSWGSRRICLPVEALHRFRDVLADPEKEWVLCNAKFDKHMLANVGHLLKGKLLDVSVMHSLLYEEMPHGLDFMGEQILGWRWKDMFSDWDKKKCPEVGDYLMSLFHNDPQKLIEYASNDAFGTMQLYLKLKDELETTPTYSLYPDRYRTLWDYFYKTQVDYTRVLWKCERNGILIDAKYLSDVSNKAGRDLAMVEREIVKAAGGLINMNSPKQMKEYFVDKLGLKPLSWNAPNANGVKSPKIDYDFLEHHARTSPTAKWMLQQRDLSKLKNTYADGLPRFFDSNGRIHATLNQNVARTGRLSSSDPNLQNIPNPEDDPWQIRAAFISSPGKHLIDFDYSALEMKLLAAASCEPGMIEAFNKGLDPHAYNGSITFNLPYEDIIKAKKKEKKDLDDYDKKCLSARKNVKTTVGFGVLYGMGTRSLAARLGCSETEAEEITKAFLARNPAVNTYMEETKEEAYRKGYAYTLMGRRRYLPQIASGVGYIRGRAERQAGNHPIQGTAAEATMMSMILIDDAQLDRRFGCDMLLQIHDELVFECPDETVDEAMGEIKQWMEHPFPTDLPVELSTEGKKARNWAEAK